MANKELNLANKEHARLAADFSYIRRSLKLNVVISNPESRRENAAKNKKNVSNFLEDLDAVGTRQLLHDIATDFDNSKIYNAFNKDVYTTQKQLTADWISHRRKENSPSIDEGKPYPYRILTEDKIEILNKEFVLADAAS